MENHKLTSPNRRFWNAGCPVGCIFLTQFVGHLISACLSRIGNTMNIVNNFHGAKNIRINRLWLSENHKCKQNNTKKQEITV